MTSKNVPPKKPAEFDEEPTQLRALPGDHELDTITAAAPISAGRPVARVAAQPRTDEDPTVVPRRVADFEDLTAQARAPMSDPIDPRIHDELTVQVPPERDPERTLQVPPSSQGRVRAATDAAALPPMRPQVRTVPTGFVSRSEPRVAVATPAAQSVTTHSVTTTVLPSSPPLASVSPRAFVPTSPPAFAPRSDATGDVGHAAPKGSAGVRLVFGVMGTIVVLIGVGVVVKAAMGSTAVSTSISTSTSTSAPTSTSASASTSASPSASTPAAVSASASAHEAPRPPPPALAPRAPAASGAPTSAKDGKVGLVREETF